MYFFVWQVSFIGQPPQPQLHDGLPRFLSLTIFIITRVITAATTLKTITLAKLLSIHSNIAFSYTNCFFVGLNIINSAKAIIPKATHDNKILPTPIKSKPN